MSRRWHVAAPAITDPHIGLRLAPGLWDFTEAYLRNASDAAYPPASRALAAKNNAAQRIPPPGKRDEIVRLGWNYNINSFSKALCISLHLIVPQCCDALAALQRCSSVAAEKHSHCGIPAHHRQPLAHDHAGQLFHSPPKAFVCGSNLCLCSPPRQLCTNVIGLGLRMKLSHCEWTAVLCIHLCTVVAQTYPYNNFEVLEVRRFSSPPMRAFNDAVDASHNIYRHRRATSNGGALQEVNV